MKKLFVIFSVFVLAVACGSDGGSSGSAFNVAGCESISVSDLGLSAGEQNAAYSELNSTFNSYALWHCTGVSDSTLSSYGSSFGNDRGIDSMLGYDIYWYKSGNEGWGYASVGGDEYLALWGSF